MARFTSIGYKRKTHVASTAEERTQQQPKAGPSTASLPTSDNADRPKKKTKRGTRGKGRGPAQPSKSETVSAQQPVKQPPAPTKNPERSWGRDPAIANKARFAVERAQARREKRQDNRDSQTTCFACRSVGHAARDCPNILLATLDPTGSATLLSEGGEDAAGPSNISSRENASKEKHGMKRKGGKMGAELTGGRCYRCDSGDHPLSQCPEPIDPANPTPFATCFICLGRGHLSSLCPTNTRGIYVNGGACKVCGSTAHRAKDCPDDKRGKSDEEEMDRRARRGRGETMVGSGEKGGGADEDDFMVDARARMTDGNVNKESGKGGKRQKHPPAKNGYRPNMDVGADIDTSRSEEIPSHERPTDVSKVEDERGPAETVKVKSKPKVVKF